MRRTALFLTILLLTLPVCAGKPCSGRFFVGPEVEYRPFVADLAEPSYYGDIDSWRFGVETSYETRFFIADVQSHLSFDLNGRFRLDNDLHASFNIRACSFLSFSAGVGINTSIDQTATDDNRIAVTLAGVRVFDFIGTMFRRPELFAALADFRFSSRWYVADTVEMDLSYYAVPTRIGKTSVGGTLGDILKSGTVGFSCKMGL